MTAYAAEIDELVALMLVAPIPGVVVNMSKADKVAAMSRFVAGYARLRALGRDVADAYCEALDRAAIFSDEEPT